MAVVGTWFSPPWRKAAHLSLSLQPTKKPGADLEVQE
jgi:hypothetical protein